MYLCTLIDFVGALQKVFKVQCTLALQATLITK